MDTCHFIIWTISLHIFGRVPFTEQIPIDFDASIFTPNHCGNFSGAITGDSTISSPGWPLTDYHNNLECMLLVKVPENKIVRLYFYAFYLEPSYECWLDRLEIWRRQPTGRPILQSSFCGDKIPPMQLMEDDFELHLISDRYDRFPGFHATATYINNR